MWRDPRVRARVRYAGYGSFCLQRWPQFSVCCISCPRSSGQRRTGHWGFWVVGTSPGSEITFSRLVFGPPWPHVFLWCCMLSLFGHVLAAAVCFGISRALGRVPVEVLVGKTGLESADRWFARWGVYAVFAGRLLPGVAFDAISFAAGLTRMRFRSFIAATALGIFPQTFLYSYLGRQAPEYVALFLVTSGLVLLGVVVVAVVRYGRERRKPRRDLR